MLNDKIKKNLKNLPKLFNQIWQIKIPEITHVSLKICTKIL